MQKSITAKNEKTQAYILYILLLIACILIFGQVIFFEFSLDDFLISENIPGRAEGWSGFWHLFLQRYNQTDYRPIVMMSYSLEKWAFNEINPSIAHFINLILFWIITMALYRLAHKFLNDEKYKYAIIFSVLIFISHPVHVEVIGNLKSRDNLLSCLFSVLSMNYIFSYLYKSKDIKNIVLGVLCFIIGFLSKLDALGILVFIPIVMLLTRKSKFKDIAIISSILLFVVLFIRGFLVDTFIPIGSSIVNKGTTFTENPISIDFSLGNRIAAAAVTFWYYLKLLLIPWGYKYYYGSNYIKLYNLSSWQCISALVAIIFTTLFIFKYFLKDKILMIVIAGYIAFILYALNFVSPVAGIIADRYVFISSIFFSGILSYTLLILINNKNMYFILSILIIITLGIFSLKRMQVWKNQLTLVETDAPSLIESYEAMRIATSTFIQFSDNNLDSTTKRVLLEKAIIYANYGNNAYPKNILLHKLQATAYFKNNQLDESKQAFFKALKIDSLDEECYSFLGDIYYINKQSDSALYYYHKALKIKNNDATIINNISSILYENGEKNMCLDFNKQLLIKQDSIFAAWENLGYYYLQEKDTVQAAQNFEKAFKYGLKNNQIANLLTQYFTKKHQEQRSSFFQNFKN